MRMALAVGAAVLLTACTSNANPKPFPLPSETVSTSPTATVATPPAMPEAANQPTPAGAKAFVRYYFDVISYAIKTGVVRDLERLSQRSCGSCASIADYLKGIYGAGGAIETAGWQVLRIRDLGESPDGRHAWALRVLQPVEMTQASPGASPNASTRAIKQMIAYLARSAGGWRVGDLEIRDGPS